MQRGARFFEKMIPMLRGARSGPRGPARSAPMQRGARFFEKNDSHAAWRSFWAAGVAPAVGQEQHDNTKG